MKKKIFVLMICGMLSVSQVYGFLAVSELMGPHDYRTLYIDFLAPLSGTTSLDVSYTNSTYSGSTSRITYGAEVHTKLRSRVDAGAGFILSPDSNGASYTSVDAMAGYTSGSRDLKLRLGGYAQLTNFQQSGSNSLSMLGLFPSAKLTLWQNLKLSCVLGLYSYSENVNSFGGTIDPWSLRNNRDLGAMVGIIGDFPSNTSTLSASYRVIHPLELFAEWSRINYERSAPADDLDSVGLRYYLTSNIALGLSFVSYQSNTYDTLGIGVYW